MMDYVFGKSEAGIILASLVRDDQILSKKVSRHLSKYNHYMNTVAQISDPGVRATALRIDLECRLAVSDEVKRFIRNVKVAKQRSMFSQYSC